MSVTNKPSQNPNKHTQTTKNVTLKDALSEDNKEVEFLKSSINDLTIQLTDTRNQLRELTGDIPSDSKSSRASEFYKNNPGLTRKEYIAGFLDLGFGKAYAATMYQKIKKSNDVVTQS